MYLSKTEVERDIFYGCILRMMEACRDEIWERTNGDMTAVRAFRLVDVYDDAEKLHYVESRAATISHTEPAGMVRSYAPERING